MRVGQPVSCTPISTAATSPIHGHVAGLGAGSGSAFALLPAQNASGNWIKIVQRVPVRIALDPDELDEHPLRVGLSMNAEIDLHDTSGPLVAEAVRDTPRKLVAGERPRRRDRARRSPRSSAATAATRRRGSGRERNRGDCCSRTPASSSRTGRDRAGARHLHAGARHHDRQRLDPDHRRQSRRVAADQGTWVITSFAVANGISVPLTGWLMRRFGVVQVFVASVLMFTIASFLCGASPGACRRWWSSACCRAWSRADDARARRRC